MSKGKRARLFIQSVLFLGAGLWGWSSEAANLVSPFDVDSAKVLPKNVRNPRFKSIFMEPTGKFNKTGMDQPLGTPLNKTLTWNDIIEGQDNEKDQKLLEGTLAYDGISESESPGKTVGEVNTFVNVQVPVFAMGITDRLTLALALPIYHVDLQPKVGFQKNASGERWVQNRLRDEAESAHTAQKKLNQPIETKLKNYGYNPIRPRVIQSIGDMQVIGKYSVYENETDAVAIKPVLTLPTGKGPDVNELIDIPTGDGQVDFGVTGIWDHALSSFFTVSTYAGYTVQFADQIERRIPKEADDPLSKDKEFVRRKLGDVVNTGTYLTMGSSTGGLGFTLGYNFQFMQKTSFEGTKYAANRYTALEAQNPYQALHSGVMSLGYATIDHYRRGEFLFPFRVALSYSQPFAGRNVGTQSVFATDLILFF